MSNLGLMMEMSWGTYLDPFRVPMLAYQKLHCLGVKLKRPAVGLDLWSLFEALITCFRNHL